MTKNIFHPCWFTCSLAVSLKNKLTLYFMLGSNILEVAIGLIFVYLLFSLLSTIINELIASLVKLRAIDLQTAIERMLDEAGKDKTLNAAEKLSDEFYKHPLIRSFVKKDEAKPSYIDSAVFSKVVTDIILTKKNVNALSTSRIKNATLSEGIKNLHAEAAQANVVTKPSAAAPSRFTETQELLLSFADEAKDDVDAFKKKMEEWFNQTMERVSGWYNRKMKIITLILGFVMAAGFNVDTFTIYNKLSTNSSVRAELAQAASDYVSKNDALSPSDGDVEAVADSLNSFLKNHIAPTTNLLGIGWDEFSWCKLPLQIGGWLVTALAISMGAPFWFDLLNKVMKLRGAGKRERSSGDEEPQPVG